MRLRIFGMLLLMLSFVPAWAGQGGKAVTLVYWGSEDCRWCRLWETADEGMEKSFLASAERPKVQYVRLKNARLVDDYDKQHFPKGSEWLWEKYDWKEFPHPFRPGWQIFVDHQLVGTWAGTSNWQQKVLPRLKAALAEQAAKR